jgi:hypothetical protein
MVTRYFDAIEARAELIRQCHMSSLRTVLAGLTTPELTRLMRLLEPGGRYETQTGYQVVCALLWQRTASEYIGGVNEN